MEYCKGGDLAQLISKCKKKGQRINEDFIWKILMQTTLALFECHRGYQQ
jgi:serine/threonine protein kinase